MSDNNGPTPETDAYYWRSTGANPAARSATELADFARKLERERDEAREQANDWHDMEAVATDMYRNRADRLKRMVRIALRWRNWYGNASATAKDLRAQLNDALEISPAMSQAKIDSLTARADKAEAMVRRMHRCLVAGGYGSDEYAAIMEAIEAGKREG